MIDSLTQFLYSDVDDPFGEFVSAPSMSFSGGVGGGFANFDSAPASSLAAAGSFASFDVAPPPATSAAVQDLNGGSVDLFAPGMFALLRYVFYSTYNACSEKSPLLFDETLSFYILLID